MSKQYLTNRIIEDAHRSTIYALGVTPDYTLTGSGASSIKLHSTTGPEYELVHTFFDAHSLGCHHIAVDGSGNRALSAGFEGTVKIWDLEHLKLSSEIPDANKCGQIWPVAISKNGGFCTIGASNGHVGVWNLGIDPVTQIRDYETKNIFTTSVALSNDGKLAASAHENGSIYIFNNETGRMIHSLTGLIKPVRCIAFSPAGKLLAACGDFQVITIFDVQSGEQVFNLSGHTSWVLSLGWSETGQFLVTSCFDGKTKVWSLDSRTCVATLGESSKPVFQATFLPSTGRGEDIVTTGDSLTFYREASGLSN